VAKYIPGPGAGREDGIGIPGHKQKGKGGRGRKKTTSARKEQTKGETQHKLGGKLANTTFRVTSDIKGTARKTSGGKEGEERDPKKRKGEGGKGKKQSEGKQPGGGVRCAQEVYKAFRQHKEK